MKEIESGEWDKVTFWRVCRSGRDHEYDTKLWNTCVRHNVLLQFIDDRLRSDNERDREYFCARQL
jgi:hypothetical protein